jgi:hypothetical protein
MRRVSVTTRGAQADSRSAVHASTHLGSTVNRTNHPRVLFPYASSWRIGKDLEGSDCGLIEAPSLYFHEGTEEHCERPRSRESVSRPRLELSTS